MYCNEVKSGQCDGRATPCVVKETYATALVDGRNGIGPVSQHIHKYRAQYFSSLSFFRLLVNFRWTWQLQKRKRQGVRGSLLQVCMEFEMAKACDKFQSCAGSNHYGIAAHYTLRAVEEGLIVSTYSVEQLELINIVRYRCIINCIYNMTSTEIEVLFMTLTEQCPGREFLQQTLLHW